MAVFKCKMCGGALEINNNETVAAHPPACVYRRYMYEKP